jgi:hypothetical protein
MTLWQKARRDTPKLSLVVGATGDLSRALRIFPWDFSSLPLGMKEASIQQQMNQPCGNLRRGRKRKYQITKADGRR